MTKSAFIDRDGVINRKAPEGEYITTWKDMQIFPGVAEAIGLLKEGGFQVIVVTNQRCVAKGLITVPDLEELHRKMCDALATGGQQIDAIYYCPHEDSPPCGCRKPAPGLLLSAAAEHHLDLQASWMIGDSVSDIRAGRSAGCRTVRILRDAPAATDPFADLTAASLLDAARQILQLSNQEQLENPACVGAGNSANESRDI